MFKFRFLLMTVGSLLLGVGMIISLVAAVNSILATQQVVSPFDQTDGVIVPDKSAVVPYVAPTISAPANTGNGQDQYRPQQVNGQDPATFRLAATETPVPIVPVAIPDRLVIPAIQLDAPIVAATLRIIAYKGKDYPQWKAPNSYAAGWPSTSAVPGIIGNTVLFGHNNTDGEIFAHLVDLKVNDLIILYSGNQKFIYAVALKMILPERNQPVDIRLQNARWILPSEDERLTLLTCWPYTSNTDRLVIVAVPISAQNAGDYPLTPRITPLAP